MRYSLQILFFLFLVYLVSSCGPALDSYYDSDYPLSSHRVFSRTNNLSFKIPLGWTAVEDNEKNIFDIWLINDDYSASLSLVPLHMDEEARENIAKHGTGELISYSKYFKRLETGNKLTDNIQDEIFRFKEIDFGAYRYKTESGVQGRIVVFEFQDISFEFEATCENIPNCDTLFLFELFKVQNSVLSSLKQ